MTEPTREDRQAVFDMFRGELAADPDRYLAPALRWVETGEGYPPSIPAHVSLDCIAELIGDARGAGLFERVEPLATEIDRLRAELATQAEYRKRDTDMLLGDIQAKREAIESRDVEYAKLCAAYDARTDLAKNAEVCRLRAELATAQDQLGRLREWTHIFGAALKPGIGEADTFGEGVRACKAQVARMLSQVTG